MVIRNLLGQARGTSVSGNPGLCGFGTPHAPGSHPPCPPQQESNVATGHGRADWPDKTREAQEI